jgi:hypothetical protein
VESISLLLKPARCTNALINQDCIVNAGKTSLQKKCRLVLRIDKDMKEASDANKKLSTEIAWHFFRHDRDMARQIQVLKSLWMDIGYSLDALNFVLSVLLPSSACSATVRSGNITGMILRGTAPGTREYFEKSVTPA